jgi:hypothetical protein
MSTASNETWKQSLRDYPPPPRPEMPVLLIQGWYYLIIGLWVAVGLSMFQSQTLPEVGLSQMWLVRLVGALVGIAGVGLIRMSRMGTSTLTAYSIGIGIALFLFVVEVVAMMNSLLPPTFMLDTAMELGFLVWWAFADIANVVLARRSQNETTGMHGHA